MKRAKRDWQTKVMVLYGDAGCGKTKLAGKLADDYAKELGGSVFTLTPAMRHSHGVWWDGYNGDEVVVIEEFEGWISRVDFKTLVNCCPATLQVKGRSQSFRARMIFITSNNKPSDWWKLDTEVQRQAWPQIARRLSPPIGTVHRCHRNPDIPASEDIFTPGFCVMGENEDCYELPPPIRNVYN